MLRPLLPSALATLFLAGVGRPAPASAQGAPMTVEGRFGAAIPVSSFAHGRGAGEGAAAGASFGVEVTLGQRWRTWYAGFSQHRFACGDAGCASGKRYVATGVNAGIRVALAPGAVVVPWLGVGALTTRLESPGLAGAAPGVSTLGVGAEVGGGIWIRATRYLAITPALRVSRVGTEIPRAVKLSLRYLVADVGLALTF